jgi:hypothetical protein
MGKAIKQFQVVEIGETSSGAGAGVIGPTTITKRTQLWVLDELGRVWLQDQHGQMKPVISEVPDTF